MILEDIVDQNNYCCYLIGSEEFWVDFIVVISLPLVRQI